MFLDSFWCSWPVLGFFAGFGGSWLVLGTISRFWVLSTSFEYSWLGLGVLGLFWLFWAGFRCFGLVLGILGQFRVFSVSFWWFWLVFGFLGWLETPGKNLYQEHQKIVEITQNPLMMPKTDQKLPKLAKNT